MPIPNSLQVHCSKCKIAEHCPANGSSPLLLSGGKRALVCRIPGGYARKPPRDGIVSEESKKARDAHGPCLTIAEVPRLDVDSGHVYTEVVKIWHPPVLHPREKTDVSMDRMYPRSHKL